MNDIKHGKFPILYKITKSGKVITWHIYEISLNNDNSIAIWKVKRGFQGGKITTQETSVNKTKKGQKNVYDQAKKDALSTFNKMCNHKGYAISIQEAKRKHNEFNPMLLSEYRDYKTKAIFPIDLQFKYDGIRIYIRYKNGNIVYHSRSGKTIKVLKHLDMDFQKIYNKINKIHRNNCIFDGELYRHNWPRSKISGLANPNRTSIVKNETDQLEVQLFDVYFKDVDKIKHDKQLSKNRIKFLLKITKNLMFTRVKVVKTYEVDREDIVFDFMRKADKMGYEGVVLKNKNGLYTFGRSMDVFKFKPEDDDVGIVVDIIQKATDTESNYSIIIQCKTDMFKDKIINITGHGTKKYKQHVFENKNEYIDMKMRYLFNGTSDELPMSAKPKMYRGKYMFH